MTLMLSGLQAGETKHGGVATSANPPTTATPAAAAASLAQE